MAKGIIARPPGDRPTEGVLTSTPMDPAAKVPTIEALDALPVDVDDAVPLDVGRFWLPTHESP